MKRCFLSILIILSSLLTQAKQFPGAARKAIAQQVGVTDSRLPYTEFEIAVTTQAAVAAYPSFKKFIGIIPVTATMQLQPVDRSAVMHMMPAFGFDKSYLDHIYPSLHYW